MTEPQAEAAQQQETRLPDIGDLVTDGPQGTDYVVSDIARKGTPTAVWDLRPARGGRENRSVTWKEIGQWEIRARRGTFEAPY